MSQPGALKVQVTTAQAENNLKQLQNIVLASLTSEHSRRAYDRALKDFADWSAKERHEGLSRHVVELYRAHLTARGLAPSTINIHLTVVRKLAREASALGWLSNETSAGIDQVHGSRKLGVRSGNWLTREETVRLLRAPDVASLKGKRDRSILALLVGCGLRRSELAVLEFRSIQQRDARWVIVDLMGKGKRVRSVPIPVWVKQMLDQWTEAASLVAGKLFRPINKGGKLWGEGITAKVVWWIVLKYARPLGFDKLAPHDLRRTCAKLCRSAGGDLEQIQLLLGHASVQTTEQYLGTRQNLTDAVNDHLGLEL